MKCRRHVLVSLLALPLAISLPAMAQAQEGFPNKPVRLIVPFAPGGTTDTVSRRVAQELSERWGDPWSSRTSRVLAPPLG